MATEAVNAPFNGTYGSHQPNPYAATETSFAGQANGPPSTTSQPEVSKEEVAWYFVESYYTTMSRTPEKLYLFFNKRSRMVQGVEEQKASVSAGQKAIKERIQSLDFQDCKVRVTNVDSQGSDDNIVIQVIGEMSNKSQPHRKFVQTFVLAGQTNGYFVLNDIFRYIREDEEEEVAPEVVEPEVEMHSDFKEPVHTANESAIKSPDETQEIVTHEPDVAEVDKKLEEVAHEEEVEEVAAPPKTNGTPAPEAAELVAENEAPTLAVSEPEAPIPVAEEPIVAEKPKAPAPTPAPAKVTPPPVAAAPPKPAVPKSWAQLVAPKAPAVSAPAPAQAAAPPPKAAAHVPPITQAKPVAAASTATPPVRQPSPAVSQREGSSGGWQTAGAEHNRSKSRVQTPIIGPDGKVRAYVKNVYAGVDADELKAHLNKFGELAYFDVSRAKNSAFAEFKTLVGFQAAIAANPHSVGGVEDIFIEERRPAGQFNPRGGARGGRGGFERPAGQGRGGANFNKDSPRGAFGASRGRGGSVTPRGRGVPNA